MSIDFHTITAILLPLVVALVVSFLSTPIVKSFACKVGAIDVPKDARRMHKVPIPRMGGLAIFLGFMHQRAAVLPGGRADEGHPAGQR